MKRTWYRITFGLIKKIFIGLLALLLIGSSHTNCVSSNQSNQSNQYKVSKMYDSTCPY